jgi:SAM-dependent methyltransferase
MNFENVIASITEEPLELATGRCRHRLRKPNGRKSTMSEQRIRFNDGVAYERVMGKWSQLVGEIFLDWLAPPSGARWIDVGCGNGAFTELLVERCAPSTVHGLDQSEEQLTFARARPASRVAQFCLGDAMTLPFPDDAFDVAVMALVLFFVPDPAEGVAEMVRVVRPGGLVAAYSWDMLGGGFPLDAIQMQMRALGVMLPPLPSVSASRIDTMRDFWLDTGLNAVETREITVQQTFNDFNDLWTTSLLAASVGSKIAEMASGDVELLKARLSNRLPADATGRITYRSRAYAVKGQVVE